MPDWLIIVLFVTGALFYLGLAVFGVAVFALWALAREQGSSGCLVCPHMPGWAIGDRRNLHSWLSFRWHRLWWGRRAWHRAAVAAYWAKRRR